MGQGGGMHFYIGKSERASLNSCHVGKDLKEASTAEREERLMQSLEVGKAHEKPRGVSHGRKNKEVIRAGKSSATE